MLKRKPCEICRSSITLLFSILILLYRYSDVSPHFYAVKGQLSIIEVWFLTRVASDAVNVKRDLKEILTTDANLRICCTVLVNSLAVTLVVSMLTASLEGRERHLNARLEVRS